MRHRVFISHCEKDADVAADLCRRIERHGVGCWIAPRDILVGEDFAVRVMDAIETSTVFVIILSRHTNRSHFVKAEAEQAFGYKIPIFPLRIENIEFDKGLKLFLSIVHRVDAFGARRGEGIDRFVDAVVAKALKGSGKPQQHSGGTDWAAIARAIGPGARDYITQWKRMDEHRTRLVWAWEAFLGGPLWPFYRGMTGFGIMLVALVAAAIALGMQALQSAQGALAGLIAGWLLASIMTGLAGSAMYRGHIDTALVRGRTPTRAMRSLWMTSSAALLIGMLALATQIEAGSSILAPIAPVNAADVATVEQSGGAKPGYLDPDREAEQRASDIKNAIDAERANALAEAATTDTMANDITVQETVVPETPADMSTAAPPAENAL